MEGRGGIANRPRGAFKSTIIFLIPQIIMTLADFTCNDVPFKRMFCNQYENVIAKEIYFDTQYMSGDALECAITFTDRNQYIIKSNTGMGGTTSFLNQRKHNVIIITPNRSQVINKQSKKDTFQCIEPLFIYGKSKGKSNTWKQVHKAMTENEKGVVVMTVVDSFLHLKETDPELYEYFKDCHVLIDECHCIIKDKFRIMMENLYNEIPTWRVSVKFSTATPQPKFLDMIPKMNIEIIKIISTNKINQPIYYTEDSAHIMKFIETERFYDRDILVFTNNAKIFNKICATYGGEGGDDISNIVHCATGKSLRNTVNKFEKESEQFKSTDIITELYAGDIKSLEYAIGLPHKRIFVCSSAYFAGWDFPKRCSILIVSDQSNKNFSLDWIDETQCCGRARNGFHNILLVNLPPSKSKETGLPIQRVAVTWKDYNPAITEDILNEKLSHINKKKEYDIVIDKLQYYNEYLTLNPEARQDQFAEYGYYVQPYITSDSKVNSSSFKFTDYMLNLMTYTEKYLESVIRNEGTYEMRNEMYVEDQKVSIGSIGPETILQYYMAWVLVKYKPPQLIAMIENDEKKRLKCKTFAMWFREFMLQFYDGDFHNIEYNYSNYNGDFIEDHMPKPTEYMVYEFLLLYTGCGYDEDDYSHEINRQIRISVVMGDRVRLFELINHPNRIEMAVTRQISRLKNSKLKIDKDEMTNVLLTEEEKKYLRINIRRNFEYLDKWATEHLDEINNWGRLHPNIPFKSDKLFNVKTKSSLFKQIRKTNLQLFTRESGTFIPKVADDRTYSPLSQLTKNLRIALPIQYICFDIKQANPSFICYLLGIPNVIDYAKIETIFSLGQGDGKVYLNRTINTEKLPPQEAIRRYKKFGLDEDDARILASWTCGDNVKKGDMFRRMIAVEKMVIDMFVDAAIKKYPNQLSKDCFFRLHDALIIPKHILLDCDLQLNFGFCRFEKTEFNGSYKWGF